MNQIFVVLSVLLLWGGAGARAEKIAGTKPNIVWIFIEDWSTDLSCYGTKGIETPHVDTLASQGIRYNQAHTTAPVCSTSRSAMMTGFHQNHIGAQDHRTKERKPLPQGIRPIPHLLQEAGYFTCLMEGTKTDMNFTQDNGDRHTHKTLFMGTDWSERKPGQPFFAQMTIGGTHRSWKRDPVNPIDADEVEIPPYYPDTPFIRRDWANGFEQMQLTDRKVGEILARLEREGLMENTLLFFTADHGRCHIRGKQFLYQGGLHVPLIVRWPGKVAPGQVSDDLVSTLDISKTILDVAGAESSRPLHGLNLFSGAVGRREHLFAARDKMDETYDAMRTVRDRRFKLIHNLVPERAYCQLNRYKEIKYPVLALMNVMNLKGELSPVQAAFMAASKPEFELYDLQADPHEINNLANDPRHQKTKADLLKTLNAWRKRIGDSGVSEQFRKTGADTPYPTKTLEEWEAAVEKWTPWVFREPGEKMGHPFPKKKKRNTKRKRS